MLTISFALSSPHITLNNTGCREPLTTDLPPKSGLMKLYCLAASVSDTMKSNCARPSARIYKQVIY